MKISEAIEKLEELKSTWGDLDIFYWDYEYGNKLEPSFGEENTPSTNYILIGSDEA